jgi:hypothetical protein
MATAGFSQHLFDFAPPCGGDPAASKRYPQTFSEDAQHPSL